MKEYLVQFWAEVGHRWINVSYVTTNEDAAKWMLSEHKREHPARRYRILVRNVTEWEELEK